ncbi:MULTISPECIES: GGDEF domain-containing protein [Acinetobacter]|uniref:GGDEF domain-containing protein n=1 Tax=Acinetobacter TaxID=469 RepID=UPI0004D93538|nr:MULTISPECIES: GGDEF domain-containing protein [Acinetobacter]KEC85090.1 diguanylate cyclase [Acinetobacter sp. ETR1]MCG7218987.1 GGDEF domain-containing protein [Acinetobacter sp. AG3]MDO6643297.1 GGDEF domain-containing protein [Acinetobacter guillouiae]UOH18418.1 GGDEF domain-containing protein [Acinetobacter sp. NyZ410]WEE39769.1 GGDEF domain-containing protein [Acinetobacter sp. TAC-1]
MVHELRSEQISTRLLILMSVIILSVLLIAVPQIISNYREYSRANRALVNIQALQVFAETSNKISRERAPTNKAMSSTTANFPDRIKELQDYRKDVDQQINLTVETLNKAGFTSLADQVDVQLRHDLNIARKQVDAYLALPLKERNSVQMDQVIQGMFRAWDSCRAMLQQLINHSKKNNSDVTDYASIVLILADLRDQSGRVASNIMAPLSFSEPLPEYNKARSLQTQEQVKYLWRLMDTMQIESLKTPEYLYLYGQVKTQFIDQGLPIVNRLVQESRNQQPYFLTANQLTDAIVDKFTTVVNLQKYLLETHALSARHRMESEQRQFFITLFISLLSLSVAVFTMLYTRKKLFEPLIYARNMILELSQVQERDYLGDASIQTKEVHTLTDALDKLKEMLKQRDAFEFQLQNSANTDSLTGVSNRLALDVYLKNIATQTERFQELTLIMVDIDNFKYVNDRFGHILGDSVIVEIARCLKANIAQSDLIVRFGGDEFLILIDRIQWDWALQISESILADVSRLNFNSSMSNEQLNVSVSIGVATGAESWEALFNRADASLFKAKAQGRNKVVG